MDIGQAKFDLVLRCIRSMFDFAINVSVPSLSCWIMNEISRSRYIKYSLKIENRHITLFSVHVISLDLLSFRCIVVSKARLITQILV